MKLLSTLRLPRHRSRSRTAPPLAATLPYDYEPFQKDGEVRIVRLMAGSTGQPLECQLIPVPLDGNQIVYEALNYVWGEPRQTESITCECRSIPITKALHTVLLHLRKADTNRDLWVDQLSINQQDVVERCQQVQRMADIYKGAEQVIIWLGLQSKFVEVAFKLAVRIRPVLRELGTHRSICDPELQERGLPSYRGKEFEALAAVIQLPWFSRAWVVQEVAMAKSALICCGPFSMPWSEFASVVSRIQATVSRRMGGFYTYSGSIAERIGQALL